MGDMGVDGQRYKLPVVSSGDVMCRTVILVNDTLLGI